MGDKQDQGKKPGKKKKKAVLAGALMAGLMMAGATVWADEETEKMKDEVDAALTNVNTRVDDVEAKVKTMKVGIAGYTQLMWVSDPTLAGKEPFFVKRMRFAFSGKINDWVKFKIQPDFANWMTGAVGGLREAYIDVGLLQDWATLRVGEYHQPFGYEPQYSSSSKKVADTPFFMSNVMTTDYDFGLFWWGNLPGSAADYLKWRVGIFNGTGTTTTENNTKKDWAAYVTTKPAKEIEIGGSFYSRYAGAAETTGSHIGVHGKLEMKEPFPWYFTAEYVGGKNSGLTKDVMNVIATWEGIVATTGGWEWAPTLRVEFWDPDTATASDEITHITPALNIYMEKNTRLLVDFVIKSETPTKANDRLNVMFQIKY